MQFMERVRGNEPGLNLRFVFQDIISKEFYIDPENAVTQLKYGRGGIVESIEKTAIACFPEGYKGKLNEIRKDLRTE